MEKQPSESRSAADPLTPHPLPLTPHSIYGLLAEFDNPTDLVAAARNAHAAGYRKMDAYTPFPIEELNDALGLGETWMAPLVLVGGLLGAVLGYSLQYYISVFDYPLNIGGRPLHSWPAFVPVTFELTILTAGLFAVLGMLALNGLPMPHHPLFNAPRFALASRDRFFLCIEAADPQFSRDDTWRFLDRMGPRSVTDVEM
jgi:hypothetical protein